MYSWFLLQRINDYVSWSITVLKFYLIRCNQLSRERLWILRVSYHQMLLLEYYKSKASISFGVKSHNLARVFSDCLCITISCVVQFSRTPKIAVLVSWYTNTGIHAKLHLIRKPNPIVAHLDIIASCILAPSLMLGCFRPNCSYYFV